MTSDRIPGTWPARLHTPQYAPPSLKPVGPDFTEDHATDLVNEPDWSASGTPALANECDEPPPRRSWRAVDLANVLRGDHKPPQPTVGARDDRIGLYYPGRLHSVVGESEGGKTWFALLSVVIELNAGHSVAYVDFEDDAAGIIGRLLALGTGREAISSRFAYIRPEDPITTGWNRADLGQALGDLRPTLVITDGVTEGMQLHGLDLKDNTDIARFGRLLLRPIAETGAAVVATDHVVKDREGRGRYALGGVHKLNAINGAQFMVENRRPFGIGTTGRSTVRIAKDRPGQLRRHALPNTAGAWFADLTLTSHDETFVEASLAPPTENNGPFRPTVLMRRVSEALGTAAEPLTIRQLQDRVTGRAEHIRAALARLVEEGYAAVKSGPRNSQLHTLLKPFAQEGDDT